MKKLTYYIDKGEGEYEPFYEYSAQTVGIDELYARQLCTYFIMRGQQYELISSEMDGEEEILVIKDLGRNPHVLDEKVFRGKGLNIEIRRYRVSENYKLLSTIPCQTHFDIIRYLLKDIVDIPGFGQKQVTSSEIDEDRGVYVLYIKDIGEEE
ncbi:RNA helicase [Cytobacillus oceanisediminis]|uniref:RNA helicase n=1 Tax=Cytobacillus oceanisediminis TaxID=665099 RepID=UPI0023DB946E|nr:RNA helicase [Cytobacillus oceanisediminis]MDF2038411.1 RNA helicase [Cytobacillus oceanisediminis]